MGEYADDYVDNNIDRWFSRRPRRRWKPREPVCNRCGCKTLTWRGSDYEGWHLHDWKLDERHTCLKVKPSDFDDLTQA